MKIRSSVLSVLLLFLASLSTNVSSEGEAMVTLDFKANYPYIFWISTWGKNDSYPEGVRYKILSSWSPKEDIVEVI